MILPFPISANVYWRVGKGRMYDNPKADEYRERVAVACLQQSVQPMTGTLRITVYAAAPNERRDTDNIVKVLFDALQGRLFLDDNQIVSYCVYRCEAPPVKSKKAHVILVCETVDPLQVRAVYDRMFDLKGVPRHRLPWD